MPSRLKQKSADLARSNSWRAAGSSSGSNSVVLGELAHAHYKNRGFWRTTVRGLLKTQAIALWQALANNLLVGHRLRAQAA